MSDHVYQYDLISLGEPLLRLSPPGFTQLRRTSSLDLFVVGSQLNVAANLARLGSKTAFLTKVPSNPLGQLTIDSCSSYGIDVSHIKTLDGGKMGVTYVEFSAAPRTALAVYDRAGSAASTITPDDFDWDDLLFRSRFAFTDGIFSGLSPTCSAATDAFFDSAKRCGCMTCFDVNYRQHLWTEESAKVAWSRTLHQVDILVTNRDVSERIFGYSGTDEELMRAYSESFGCKVVCLTSREIHGLQRGAWNSKAYSGGTSHEGQRIEFNIVDRYGTGDAWFAGFLYGYSEGDLQFALNFGNAACALAHTIEGDIAHITDSDVRSIMDGKADLRVKR